MACGIYPDREDCAAFCWAPRLHGQRERGGQYRAPCPLCQAARALQYDVPGRTIRWKSFCGHHDKEALRPVLAELLGPCFSAPRRRPPVDHDELAALALSGIPATALKVALLELSGLSRPEAMSKLGVDRASRYRITGELSQFCDKRAGR